MRKFIVDSCQSQGPKNTDMRISLCCIQSSQHLQGGPSQHINLRTEIEKGKGGADRLGLANYAIMHSSRPHYEVALSRLQETSGEYRMTRPNRIFTKCEADFPFKTQPPTGRKT